VDPYFVEQVGESDVAAPFQFKVNK
jgi:hypothetical protein